MHDTHWSSQACNHRPGWGQECGKGHVLSLDIGADSPTCMIHTGPRRLATIDQVGGRSVGKDMLCQLISERTVFRA